MLSSSKRDRRRSGQSLLLFTFISALVLIPMIGLAIDGAILFWVKAKLSAAVDAAALAAGRTPLADASITAQQYVYANFPPGWMGTTFSVPPTAIPTNPSLGMRQVTVNASVTVPLRFMAILGFKQSTAAAVAVSTRRNANVILVLDRSSSMNIIGPDGAKVCDTMKAAATTFVNYFVEGQDQVGLVSFHTWANLDYPMSTTFQSNMTSILSDLTCGANTSSAMALNLAYNQIKGLGSSAYANNGVLNAIVFFTDGNPNGLTAVFPPKDKSDDRYYANPGYYDNIDYGMPATTSQCISSLRNSSTLPGVLIQGSSSASTGLTQGIYQIPAPAPTQVCASGQSRAICDTDLTILQVAGCYFTGAWNSKNSYPATGPTAPRQDIAYIPLTDWYGDSTSNTSFMTQSADLITGPYAGSGRMRIDTPQSVTDASFNAADAQALAIISDPNFKPTIYAIGLGGATDVANEAVFQAFLQRVANDPASSRFNASLPVGSFVYSPDDTQLQSAFHQIASKILRLSK
jgi:Flp pilus assembly protein TadG